MPLFRLIISKFIAKIAKKSGFTGFLIILLLLNGESEFTNHLA